MYSFSTSGAVPNQVPPTASQPMGGTSASRALNMAQSAPLPPTMPLIPPMSQATPALKSHSIQHPNGTVVTQEFHKPESGLLGGKQQTPQKTEAPQTPQTEMKIVNGMHHIPFKSSDGSTKFINAKGEVTQ